MGCDIHLYAEAKKNGEWVSLDKYTKNEYFGKCENEPEFHIAREDRFYTDGRNYNLFCALCGVRSGLFFGNPPMVSKPKGIPVDSCNEIKQEVSGWGSDGHSHSWNTLKELKEFNWSDYGDTVKHFLNEVLPKMEAVGVNSEDVRIVYFFDN